MTEIFDPSAFLSTVSGRPGVYRMFDSDARLLYVGKAKNLKKRLASYFRKAGLAPKTAALVGRIAQVETTITANETEALLLEQTLIKEWRPPYNILLRDDKSYPYVFLSDGQFPRLSIHRGAKKAKGKYFGPYPSAGAIRESLSLLQKAFLFVSVKTASTRTALDLVCNTRSSAARRRVWGWWSPRCMPKMYAIR
jgi:Nuclease subunit of the excinuclease complex